jgi:hypothetical protein
LGRAAIALQAHPGTRFRNDLLYACTNNLVYDQQCDETRGRYLFELIKLTGDAEFYRDGIISVLYGPMEDKDHGDSAQIFELARMFAQQGDAEARQAMYTAFEREGLEKSGLHSARELISLDGWDAFLMAADQLANVEEAEQEWQFSCLTTRLEEQDGKDVTEKALNQFAVDSPHSYVARQWLALRKARERAASQRQDSGEEPRRDYSSIKAEIEQKGRVRHASWGKTATTDELEQAADDLLAETDVSRLWSYLSIFHFRRFPRSPDFLIALARNDDRWLARTAINALGNMSDPVVRAFGLKLATIPERSGHGVELLAMNYEGGDYLLLERLLKQKIDDDPYHSLGMGVRSVVEAHPAVEAEPALLLLYENGPCALCRHACVEHLMRLNRFPDWMCAECFYDSYSETRELIPGSR